MSASATIPRTRPRQVDVTDSDYIEVFIGQTHMGGPGNPETQKRCIGFLETYTGTQTGGEGADVTNVRRRKPMSEATKEKLRLAQQKRNKAKPKTMTA